MASSWNLDFLDLVDCFIAEEVEYLVVGAFALAAHGLPRATGDIDFWVRAVPANASRVMRALARFGAPLAAAGISEKDFASPGTVFQMGVAPRRIDILSQITGVRFDEAAPARVLRTIDGRSVPFLGLGELLRNKKATGRPKDLADVDGLERLHRKG